MYRLLQAFCLGIREADYDSLTTLLGLNTLLWTLCKLESSLKKSYHEEVARNGTKLHDLMETWTHLNEQNTLNEYPIKFHQDVQMSFLHRHAHFVQLPLHLITRKTIAATSPNTKMVLTMKTQAPGRDPKIRMLLP